MLKFDYRPIYAGNSNQAFQGLINAEMARGEQYVKAADEAQGRYDKVMTYITSIQPASESGRQYIREFADKITKELGSIATDAKGNIKWHEAKAATTRLAMQTINDETLTNIRNNSNRLVAEQKVEQELRSRGLSPLGFQIDGFEDISFDENGNRQLNTFKGFYEAKGQHQEGWNNVLNNLGDDSKMALRELASKTDRTPEEQALLDRSLDFLYNTGKEATPETAQDYRKLKELYNGDEEKIKQHIVNNRLPFAIQSKSKTEQAFDISVRKAAQDMEDYKTKSDIDLDRELALYHGKQKINAAIAAEAEATKNKRKEEEDALLNAPFSTIELGATQISNKQADTFNDEFLVDGRLNPEMKTTETITKQEYDKLSPDQQKQFTEKVKMERGDRPNDVKVTYTRDKSTYQDSVKAVNNMRKFLVDSKYGGMTPEQINNLTERDVTRIIQNATNAANYQLLRGTKLDNPKILGNDVQIDIKDIQLGSSSWKVVGNKASTSKDQKKLGEILGVSKVDDIQSVRFAGISHAGSETTGLGPGSLLYEVVFKDGSKRPALVARPSGPINTQLETIFRPIAKYNDMVAKLPFSSVNAINEKGSSVKVTDIIGDVPYAVNQKMDFRAVKYIDANGNPAMLLKPTIKLGDKRFALDAITRSVDNTTGKIKYVVKPERASTAGGKELATRLESDAYQDDVHVAYNAIISRFNSPSVNLSYNDVMTYTHKQLQQADFVRNSVLSAKQLSTEVLGTGAKVSGDDSTTDEVNEI